MNTHLPLFHLYQNEGKAKHSLKLNTRNNRIPLLNTKSALINQEPPNFNSLEYRLHNSFRSKLKQTKVNSNSNTSNNNNNNNASNNSNLTKNKGNSLYQIVNIKPKYKSDYNSFTRNTQPLRNNVQNNKQHFEQKKQIYLNTRQVKYFLTQKENLKQLLYSQHQPYPFIPKDNSKCQEIMHKNDSKTFNPQNKIVLKSNDSSKIIMQCPSKTNESLMSSNKIKDNQSNSKKSDGDELGVLSLNEVKDIIIYNNFSSIDKDWNYLFHQDDYDGFLNSKAIIYIDAFALN